MDAPPVPCSPIREASPACPGGSLDFSREARQLTMAPKGRVSAAIGGVYRLRGRRVPLPTKHQLHQTRVGVLRHVTLLAAWQQVAMSCMW